MRQRSASSSASSNSPSLSRAAARLPWHVYSWGCVRRSAVTRWKTRPYAAIADTCGCQVRICYEIRLFETSETLKRKVEEHCMHDMT